MSVMDRMTSRLPGKVSESLSAGSCSVEFGQVESDCSKLLRKVVVGGFI